MIKASPGNQNIFLYDETVVIPGKHLGRSHSILTTNKLNKAYFYLKCTNSDNYSAICELTGYSSADRTILLNLLREYHPENFI